MDDKEMAAMKMIMVSSEEEEEEGGGGGDFMERVCLQVQNGNPYRRDIPIRVSKNAEHKWYVDVVVDHLDHNNDAASASASNAVEIQGMSRQVHEFTACASANSTVYVFGGYNPHGELRMYTDPKGLIVSEYEEFVLSDLWYTDTSYNGGGDDGCDIYASGWIKGASMNHPRVGARAVVVEGKIYAFGGVRSPSSHTWAEVYDIKSDRWSLLLPPSPDVIISSSIHLCKCAALDFDFPKKTKLILVYFYGPLYSYDAILGTWELLDANFGSIENGLVVVSVSCGGTSFPVLLTIKDDGQLYGYHLGLRKWFDGPVNVLDEGNDYDALPRPDSLDFINSFHLVPLGRNNEKLCVLWTFFPSDHSGLCVRCTKLSLIYEEDDHSSLAANVESTNLFKLHNGDALINCLPLRATRRGRKRAGESIYMEEKEKEKKNKH